MYTGKYACMYIAVYDMVYMYLCVHVRTFCHLHDVAARLVCMYTFACKYVYVYIHIQIYFYIDIEIRICICLYTYMCTCVYVHMYICAYVYVCAHV